MPPKRKTIEGDDRTPPIDKTVKVVDEFSRLFKEQAKVHGEQIHQLLSMHTSTQGHGGGRVQGTTESSEDGAYDRFRRMNPPEFIGGADPLVALEWVKSLEAIFDYLKFIDQDKVSCAVFMLVKAARIWWEATKVTVNVRELKWDEFKEFFYAKYFSREVKAKKVKECLELKHDALSVTEYTLNFEEGCVFVPFIAENDKDKGEHFLRGLKPEIRRDVHMSKVVTYQDIVERALLAEHDEQEIEKERQLRSLVGGYSYYFLPSSYKLLHKGCMGYLASVVDVRKEINLQFQDIDVVQDYPDVFADDVSGLPPDREVEFVIDLIPDRIWKGQQLNAQLLELKRKSDLTGVSKFGSNRNGLLTFRGRICVPMGDDNRKEVLLEAHTTPYSVHHGSTKMYQDL
ncbi:uncharacterized protein [Primulina huaijiensis]|uniref:uncharacterized protein n=1 Tax=Primulina huaijiensis TaxID=1492673 RepID=UPI003CC6EB64